MLALRQCFACLATAIVFLSTSCVPSLGQDPAPCSRINYVGVGCAMFKFVGVQRGKPFAAQRVVVATASSADQGRKNVEWIESVSRDSVGRVRFEQTEAFKPPKGIVSLGLYEHELEKVMLPSNTLERLVVIFDCFGGKGIVLQPDMKT